MTSEMCAQALGRTKLVPGKASQPVRGVFSLEPEAVLSGATVFLETPHAGLTLRFDQPPKVYLASDLSDPAVTPLVPDGILDSYRWYHVRPEKALLGCNTVLHLPSPCNSFMTKSVCCCRTAW